jgi:hypothetical protein
MGRAEDFAQHWLKAEALGQRTTLADWPHRWHVAQARVKESEGDFDAALDLRMTDAELSDEARRASASAARSLLGGFATLSGGYDAASWIARPELDALFDPQTSGGLLFGVTAARADEAVAKLHAAGDVAAVCIGEVAAASADGALFTVVARA